MTDALAAAGLAVRTDGPVVTVTLDRPEHRNLQSPSLWAALAEVGDTLPAGTRVVVLRAEGPSFSAGLDVRLLTAGGVPGGTALPHLLELDDADLTERIAVFQRAFTAWRRCDVVSIAAVRGHAVGAGFQLALACDLRVCGDSARFSMRETSLGLVPDLGGTRPLVEAVGYSRALEICLTGRSVDAAEALRLGLATIVVPDADVDDATADLVAALLAPPSEAVAATKALLAGAAEQGYDAALAAERAAQVPLLRARGRAGEGRAAPGNRSPGNPAP